VPIEKFRSAAEMQAAPAAVGSSDVERFFRHCARLLWIAPPAYPRGVFRFRTLEEAQAARATHRSRANHHTDDTP
jgi:hypothetical protein